ncbi:MAG: hypothetical protein WBQ34_07350 [Candidatus Acidiferrales bacterium]
MTRARNTTRRFLPLLTPIFPLWGAAVAVLLIAPGAVSNAVPPSHNSQPRPLTVADCIEARAVVSSYGKDPVRLSPRGDKYLIVLKRGDLQRNGEWYDLLVGGTASLQAASKLDRVARLFTTSTAEQPLRQVRWMSDDEHVMFLWQPKGDLPQIFEADTSRHRIRSVTDHRTEIVRYDASRDGSTIIFISQAPHNDAQDRDMLRTGFAVTTQSIFSLLEGDVDGWTPWSHYQTFVRQEGRGQPREIREPPSEWMVLPELLALSPDGRFAVMVRPAPTVPRDWNLYTDRIFKDIYLPAARNDPGAPNMVRQYFLVDVRRRTAKPLWSAPENPRGEVLWSPGGSTFLLGPTFLPTARADAAGLSGRALVEINPRSGRFNELPLPAVLPEAGYRPLGWQDADTIDVGDASGPASRFVRLRYRKVGGSWRFAPVDLQSTARPAARIRIELRQDLNQPPAFYAVDSKTGREKQILDLDPKLGKRVALGHVALVHWSGTDGLPWSGVLYYPVDYRPRTRFPLVIQTHGYSAKKFSLEGSFTTVFAAQPLANRDIAVLQMGGPDTTKQFAGTPQEPQVLMRGFEGAIRDLASRGIIDSGKVGIVGFSRTGWYVEYMLTHSRVPIAAAEVADNMDASYLQYLVSDAGERAEFEADNGARPLGNGLQIWLRVAPGFNADKIHTPLRMEIDTRPLASILGFWELFSNLRYLGKPVELTVIPDIDDGVHLLQNPRQRLVSEGETVDWFCFWLKGEEDPNPSKSAEYARWRMLRQLQEREMTSTLHAARLDNRDDAP